MQVHRRKFLKTITTAAAGLSIMPDAFANTSIKDPFFAISLAEWSLNKSLFSKKISNLDFPGIAKKEYGINTVEYVNQFFKDKAEDTVYLNELLKRCRDNGVTNHLIMIDEEGPLGSPEKKVRNKAVENHYKWVDAAKYLGCKIIRVNAHGEGSAADVQIAVTDGLGRLAEYAEKAELNVTVENHGGYSSNGEWLAEVMKKVDRKSVGTLPDFGNFCLKSEGYKCLEAYDKYKGTKELLPYAKGISAKTFDFDAEGNCIETDYTKMLTLLKESGFSGYLGVEYEGEKWSESEGILKTKALILKVAANINYEVRKSA